MAEPPDQYHSNLTEVRAARNQAEMLRDQLSAEYHRLMVDAEGRPVTAHDEDPRQRLGREAMRKAVQAVNRALESIDQALRDMERADDESLSC